VSKVGVTQGDSDPAAATPASYFLEHPSPSTSHYVTQSFIYP